MKKIGILLLALFFVGTIFAQNVQKSNNLIYLDRKPVHWGFTFGANTMGFTIHKNSTFLSDSLNIYGIENQIAPGFHLGPIVNFRLGRYFDLRFLVNLSFGQRTLNYYTFSGSASDTVPSSYATTPMKIASTFIEFPLLLKYKGARINNMRPYLITGVNTKYDLAARKALKESNSTNVHLETLDVYFEFGVGFDWYLPYFKLSTELKFGKGFMDVLKRDGTIYTSPIDKMTSKMLMLSFHFEG